MDSICGIVAKVLKRNDDGSAFLAVEYETPFGLVDAKMGGAAGSLTEGDGFTARGRWRRRVWRGVEEEVFSAQSVRADLPATPAGAVSLLSRVFDERRHGISRQAVEAFVARRGARALRDVEADPALLLSLSTNPAGCREAILTEWARRTSNRRAVGVMEQSGVEDHVIGRILDVYRDGVLEALRVDPYQFSRIPDVGFANADRIGRHLGIPEHDARRLGAAVLDVVREVEQDGHTYAGLRELVEECVKTTGVGADTVKAFLAEAVRSRDTALVVEQVDGRVVAQARETFLCEAYVARTAARLRWQGRRLPEDAVDRALVRTLADPQFSRFDEVQRQAIRMAVLEPLSILTGGPGTGKSTVMAAVARAARALGERDVLLVAPTGKAAKRLQETAGQPAMTVHKLLGAREDAQTGGSRFTVNRTNPLKAGCFVVVDEASMLDAETMAALLDALPPDGRLLLVGDKHQLPSVGPGNVLADLMAAGGSAPVVPRTELVNVYRQSRNSAIATAAAEIREGVVPYLDRKVRGGVSFYEVPGTEIVDRISTLLTGPVRMQLGYDPARDVAVICPQAPGTAGTWDINRRLSLELNPDGKAVAGISHGPKDDRRMPLPRLGDRVMLTVNDDENDVMNGDVGTLVDVVRRGDGAKQRDFLKVAYDCGRTVELPVHRWRDLILAYAGTVHRSQGSQYPVVVLPATMAHANMLDRHLFYTGWTRAQNLLIVVGEREAVEHAIASTRLTRRNTRLREMLERAAAEFAPPAPAAAPRPAPAAPVRRMGFARPMPRTA